MEEIILNKAKSLFTAYGIKSISMDDLAKDLSISKKTIYNFYKDKNDLVNTMMLSMINENQCLVNKCCGESKDAIHETIIVLDSVVAMMSKINPSFFFDMQKFHKKTWLLFQKFRNEFILDKISKCLNRGVKDGHFRPELSIPIVSKLRIATLELLFDPAFYQESDIKFPEAFKETTIHFLYGCASTKGHKQINLYLNTIDDN